MDKAMIDWNKPIETVDGRKARKIQTVKNELWNIVFVPGENFGDVFLINDEGCICGERTILRIRKPFIRNVRVKREGWVNIYAVHETKEDAEKACADLSRKCARFVRWEE